VHAEEREDHPILRARRHAAELRRSGLPIYMDAASADALSAHDGAEHLHRVLWELDIVHEYHLRRDTDHVGPEIVERLRDAFAWAGAHLIARPGAPLTLLEQAWQSWLRGDRRLAPPGVSLPPTSALFPVVLRAQLAPLREAAARSDATVERRYGVLPHHETSSGVSSSERRTDGARSLVARGTKFSRHTPRD
jgi:S-formylglutathione hydrolase